jgi:hypothetical protein
MNLLSFKMADPGQWIEATRNKRGKVVLIPQVIEQPETTIAMEHDPTKQKLLVETLNPNVPQIRTPTS